jgi:dipeptidyl aminopeptidase/acylaminoacyl peptidase
VTIPSVPGVQLAATVTLPAGAGPFPAVVFVPGSGPHDRDETIVGHRPFLVIADYLARRGIASVRYDDRGVGKSTGDFGRATLADLADDAEAAVRFARTVPGVAPDRVGILGHSEGGLIGPMVAARSRDVAFVVMLAGPGVPLDSLLLLQGAATARAEGVPATTITTGTAMRHRLFAAVRGAGDSADAAARVQAALQESLAGESPATRDSAAALPRPMVGQLLSPSFRYLVRYDPGPALRQVRVPVLALDGTLDTQVPAAEDLAAVAAALKAGGNRDFETVALPGLNHLFQTARTGAPSEYATTDETVAPAAMERIAAWIARRFAAPAARGAVR